MMRIIWLETRHAGTKWLAPALVFFALFISLTELPAGLYLWSDATSSLDSASGVINPLVTGWFVWEVGRRERAGFGTRLGLSGQRTFVARLAHLTGMMVWILASGLLSTGILAIYLGAHSAWGRPIWAWVFATASGTVLSAALGAAIGRLARGKWWAAPLAAMGLYFVFIALSAVLHRVVPYWITMLYPIAYSGTDAFVAYIEATFVGQIMWYLGVSAVLVLILDRTAGHRTTVARLSAVLVCVIVASAGAGIVAANGGAISRGFNARIYKCASVQISICVHPGYAAGLPKLERAFQHLNQRTNGTSLHAAKLEQNVMGVGDVVSPRARDVYLENLAPGFARDSMTDYVLQYGGAYSCRTSDSQTAHRIVDDWLTDNRGDLDTFGGSDLRVAIRFRDLTDAQKNSWLRTHEKAYFSCHLDESDFE
jgi:hypothetical protein